jgi:C-methyltransferase
MSRGTIEQQQAVTPATVFEALLAFQATAVVGTAVKLGVFDEIAAGSSTAKSVARAIGAAQRGVEILLDALAAIGFLNAVDDEYRVSPVAEAFLVRTSPAYLGGLVDIFYSDWQWQGHLALPDAVRNGGTVTKEQNLETAGHPFWSLFADAFTGAAAPMAQAVAAALAPWTATRDPLEVIDLACGSGVFGATIASGHDHARVTFVDWPTVLARTRTHAERYGVADRASYIEGDMFDVALAGPYDLAVASQLFHHFERGRCVELMRRIAAALKPGGQIAIHDFMRTGNPAHDPQAALFSVIMLVRTAGGQSHTLADHEAMLAEAGFTEPRLHNLPGLPMRLLTASVP